MTDFLERIVRDVEEGLETLRRHLADIRNAQIPKSTGPVLNYLNEPWARALTKLPGTYTMVLANIELLLSAACKAVDPDATVDAFVSSVDDGTKPSYWSAGAIAQGIADTAVKVGVLQPDERERLLAKRVWDAPSFAIGDCVTDLEESIKFLSSVLQKVKSYL